MPRRPSLPPPRSTGPERSLARTAACAPVAIPVVDRVNASVDEAPDQPDGALVLASQLLTVELLRQPLDSAQYTAAEFHQLLDANKITQSFSRPRQCWDNSVAESWFATLKLELIDRQSWATRSQVRRAVFEFIEVFYNRKRLHSSLNCLSPAEYERQIHHQQVAQAA